jgi:hypothetical protein
MWENGFGVVFPEVAGEPGFDDVARVLDLIESLPVQLVVPGHGAPFTDAAAALTRARSRLAAFQADPARHVRHAAKVLIKYHLMEERQMPYESVLAWAAATPLLQGMWQRKGRNDARSPESWAAGFVDELVASGALARHEGVVLDI